MTLTEELLESLYEKWYSFLKGRRMDDIDVISAVMISLHQYHGDAEGIGLVFENIGPSDITQLMKYIPDAKIRKHITSTDTSEGFYRTLPKCIVAKSLFPGITEDITVDGVLTIDNASYFDLFDGFIDLVNSESQSVVVPVLHIDSGYYLVEDFIINKLGLLLPSGTELNSLTVSKKPLKVLQYHIDDVLDSKTLQVLKDVFEKHGYDPSEYVVGDNVVNCDLYVPISHHNEIVAAISLSTKDNIFETATLKLHIL